MYFSFVPVNCQLSVGTISRLPAAAPLRGSVLQCVEQPRLGGHAGTVLISQASGCDVRVNSCRWRGGGHV